jgi:hypothetical protein
MGKNRIIKAISSVVKPPTGGFFVPVILDNLRQVNLLDALTDLKTPIVANLSICESARVGNGSQFKNYNKSIVR